MRRAPRLLAALSLALPGIFWGCVGSAPRLTADRCETSTLTVELLHSTVIPPDSLPGAVPVGGLSGLAWDPVCGELLAVSDDPGGHGPVRMYRLRLEHRSEAAGDVFGGVEVLEAISPRAPDGGDLGRGTVDLEGLALAPDGGLWLASEGAVAWGVPPFVRRHALDGTFVEELELPAHVLPGDATGVRHNLAFEGLSVTEDGRWLFAGLENALRQDGPEASLEHGSPVRILRWDLLAGGPPREVLYLVEPAPDRPATPGGASVNGLSEIVALDRDRLLVLERSFAAGVGNRARLYLAELAGATDISGQPVLPDTVTPVAKERLAAIRDLGVTPDNLEGMTLGPTLADGRRALLLVSDDNFQPAVQDTQLLVLAVRGLDPGAPVASLRATVPEIQGEGMISPLVGRCVIGVRGVVTAVGRGRDSAVAWLQDAAGDDRDETSDGLRLRLPADVELAVGDLVELDGRVAEPGRGVELPVTELAVSSVRVLRSGEPLPAPVVLGGGGRPLPGALGELADDPFAAASGAHGFFESLEGMRVRVDGAVVVGPTSRYGEPLLRIGALFSGLLPFA